MLQSEALEFLSQNEKWCAKRWLRGYRAFCTSTRTSLQVPSIYTKSKVENGPAIPVQEAEPGAFPDSSFSERNCIRKPGEE